MQHVQQFGRVFGEPAFGLNIAERRRRTPITNLRALAVPATVAKPLRQDVLARDLISPDLRRHVSRRTPPRCAGGGSSCRRKSRPACGRDGLGWRHPRGCAARLAPRAAAGGPSGSGIGEALAERVQPDHLAPEPGCFVKQGRVAGQRNAQAGLHEIGREARGIGGVRGDGGEIGDDIFRCHLAAVDFAKPRQHGRADIRFRSGGFAHSGNARPPRP